MNKHFLITIAIILVAFSCFGQIPSVEIKDINGKTFSTDSIDNEGKPIILFFWATWSRPGIKALNELSSIYNDWQTETGVKIYAISVNDKRSIKSVSPYAKSQGWNYKVLLDVNGDFKKALYVTVTPHLLVLGKERNVVWQKKRFSFPINEDSDEILDILKKVKDGKENEIFDEVGAERQKQLALEKERENAKRRAYYNESNRTSEEAKTAYKRIKKEVVTAREDSYTNYKFTFNDGKSGYLRYYKSDGEWCGSILGVSWDICFSSKAKALEWLYKLKH